MSPPSKTTNHARRLEPVFSSRSNEWPTPQDFYDALDEEFAFTLDPCATHENAKCERFFTKADDGLAQPWEGVVFMNPPYACVKRWMAKAVAEAEQGALVVALVVARTDTLWWHEFVMAHAAEVRLVRGRLRFGGGHTSAPFPSAVIVFRPGAEGPPTFTTMLRPCSTAPGCSRRSAVSMGRSGESQPTGSLQRAERSRRCVDRSGAES